MIHYDLRCTAGHEFDGWFKDSAGFEAQAQAGFVECPVCGATEITKRLMAPAIPKKGRSRVKEAEPPPPAPPVAAPPPLPPPGSSQAAAGPVPAQVMALLQRMRAEVEKNCDYVGPGYGQPTPGMTEAVLMLARLEGVLLDPVYSGKAMAGLIDLIRKGEIRKGETVVFLHTGGAVALFADEFSEF